MFAFCIQMSRFSLDLYFHICNCENVVSILVSDIHTLQKFLGRFCQKNSTVSLKYQYSYYCSRNIINGSKWTVCAIFGEMLDKTLLFAKYDAEIKCSMSDISTISL